MKAVLWRIHTLLTTCSRYVSKLRYQTYRLLLASAGERGSIGVSLRIHGRPTIHLANRVTIRNDVQIAGHGILEIGSNTSINDQVIITVTERVSIGCDVMIAPRAYILDVDHRIDLEGIPISKQGYISKPVDIGDDVWIGAGAIITKGVKIGRGSIVAANAVVTRDIPANVIVAGVPARILRNRWPNDDDLKKL
jgi:acetyltransferase-like isoleucine patch superfamily enzyme